MNLLNRMARGYLYHKMIQSDFFYRCRKLRIVEVRRSRVERERKNYRTNQNHFTDPTSIILITIFNKVTSNKYIFQN